MDEGRGIRRLLPELLLAAMLLATQFGVALHSAGHEPGVPQTSVCKTCIAADQLAAATIDRQETTELDPARSHLVLFRSSEYRSAQAPSARQRSPPVVA